MCMSCSKKSSSKVRVGASPKPYVSSPKTSTRAASTYGTPKIKFGAKGR